MSEYEWWSIWEKRIKLHQSLMILMKRGQRKWHKTVTRHRISKYFEYFSNTKVQKCNLKWCLWIGDKGTRGRPGIYEDISGRADKAVALQRKDRGSLLAIFAFLLLIRIWILVDFDSKKFWSNPQKNWEFYNIILQSYGRGGRGGQHFMKLF